MPGNSKPLSEKRGKEREHGKGLSPLMQMDLEAWITQQGIKPIENPENLKAEFWPEDETADQFLDAVRRWRREETNRRTS